MVVMEYCTDKNILNVELVGKIGLEEMKAYCEKINNDTSLPRSLRILEDATLAEFDFDIDEIDQINQIIVSQIGTYTDIVHAMLRIEPISTAYGIMSEMANINNPRYLSKVFSTRHMAMNWLSAK